MKRHFFTLLAALLALAKPFLSGAILVSLGVSDAQGLISALLRYMIVAQLFVPICLFFLWFDREKYSAFRPLLILVQVLSLVALLLCMYVAVYRSRDLLLTMRNMLVVAGECGLVMIVDIVSLVAAVAVRTATVKEQ